MERFGQMPGEFRIRRFLLRASFGLLLVAPLPISTAAQNHADDLANLSVEDLMNVEVTSVSKKEQKVSRHGRRHLRDHPGGYPALGRKQHSRTYCAWCRA